MAEIMTIRPSQPQVVRWTLLALLIALFAFLLARMLVAGPNRIHCTQATCWVTIDTPFGDFVEGHRVTDLAAGHESLELGKRTDVARDFNGFLNSPSAQSFDASYPNPDAHETSLGLAIILALFVWTLATWVRGSSAHIVVDRKASQLVVRSWPLMFGNAERRGKLEGARADIEVRKVYVVVPRRYLVIRSGHDTLLELRVIGKRHELAAVRALLQQPA